MAGRANTLSTAYHIHQNQAPALNCGCAGGHLDPYNVTDSVTCDPKDPSKCQVGDLSGKHGNMTGASYSAKCVTYSRMTVHPD